MLELITLGTLAGMLPVYLGILLALAIARVIPRSLEGFLIGLATGILVYLFFDLMHEAVELTEARDRISWAVFLGSLFVSFVGLIALEQSRLRRNRTWGQFLTLPYVIALGMGLHNFGEGLAIGASYANGEWVLSGVLIVGFALHNSTEGFGIVGSAGRTAISWKDAALMGLLAGAPTCLGTLLSGSAPSVPATLICYTLAAGSLLYVIIALIAISYTASRRLQVASGLFAGISLMFVTAMILTLVSGIRT